MRLYFGLYCICFLIILNVQSVFSQKDIEYSREELDSLIELSESIPDGFEKIELVQEIAKNLLHMDPKGSLKYLTASMEMANKAENDSLITYSYYLHARFHCKLMNVNSAIDYCFKALESKQYLDEVVYADVLNLLGYLYKESGDIDLALKYFNKAYVIYDSLNYFQGLSYTNLNFGNIYYEEKEFEISLKYLLEAMEYSEKFDIVRAASFACGYIGNVYTELGQYEMALTYYQKGLIYSERVSDIHNTIWLKMNMGNLYVRKGEIEKGIELIEEVKKESLEKDYKSMVLESTKILGKIYASKKQYRKGYKNLKIYKEFQDSVFNAEVVQKIARMDFKYETEIKKQEELLNALRKEKQIKVQRLYFISFLTGFLILLLFLFYYFRNKIKINKSEEEIIRTGLEREELKSKNLQEELRFKNNELEKFALLIIQKNDFIKEIKNKITKLNSSIKIQENKYKLNDLSNFINNSLSLTKDRKEFQSNIDAYYKYFLHKIENELPVLTDMEKRLAVLLRLNFSTKEVAALFNISFKSVEVYRSNLRKKIGMNKEQSLVEYLSNLE